MMKMKPGDKWELYIPSELAYGSKLILQPTISPERIPKAI
jgi:FKBP-type peptidyl-prolyl cis-trans isomerase